MYVFSLLIFFSNATNYNLKTTLNGTINKWASAQNV